MTDQEIIEYNKKPFIFEIFYQAVKQWVGLPYLSDAELEKYLHTPEVWKWLQEDYKSAKKEQGEGVKACFSGTVEALASTLELMY